MKRNEVGYKKPPRHTQFKKGNTEYSKRRPKPKLGVENEILQKFLAASVGYRDGGKMKFASRLEVDIQADFAGALKGDVGAAVTILRKRAHYAKLGNIYPTVLWMSKAAEKL